MFRREIDGETLRFSVIGLWGSGNVVAERRAALNGNETAYTMWDGHALYGPGRPDTSLEKVGMLLAKIPMAEFVDRYASLGDACEVWLGDETLGVGCEDACATYGQVCAESDLDVCLADCALQPRARADCLAAATTCAEGEDCGAPLTTP